MPKKIKVRPKVKGPEVSDPVVLEKLDRDSQKVRSQIERFKKVRTRGYNHEIN